jgi:hypothetical protein
MEYSDFKLSKRYKLSYDADQPKRAFSLEEFALVDRAAP